VEEGILADETEEAATDRGDIERSSLFREFPTIFLLIQIASLFTLGFCFSR